VLLFLFLKGKQLQAGANWDSVVGISIAIILVASVALIVGLIVSRFLQNRRFKRSHFRARRRETR
jgi:hypothetical protein